MIVEIVIIRSWNVLFSGIVRNFIMFFWQKYSFSIWMIISMSILIVNAWMTNNNTRAKQEKTKT